MEYGIIIAAVSLFGTFALVMADATMESEPPADSMETENEAEQRQAA